MNLVQPVYTSQTFHLYNTIHFSHSYKKVPIKLLENLIIPTDNRLLLTLGRLRVDGLNFACPLAFVGRKDIVGALLGECLLVVGCAVHIVTTYGECVHAAKKEKKLHEINSECTSSMFPALLYLCPISIHLIPFTSEWYMKEGCYWRDENII